MTKVEEWEKQNCATERNKENAMCDRILYGDWHRKRNVEMLLEALLVDATEVAHRLKKRLKDEQQAEEAQAEQAELERLLSSD